MYRCWQGDSRTEFEVRVELRLTTPLLVLTPNLIPFHDALMEELLKIHPCAPTLAYGPSSHEIKHERRHSTVKFCRCQRMGAEFKTCGRVRRLGRYVSNGG
jgi:hypothetical protein